ncbi:hypothetical protein [Halobellus rufus]|uniref:hypothetical protein n=1 Tax=Halobellus rufus TaxID=1448860 RepID=UPI0006799556|nr:hypothetical protein [Halobellus rufus]
MPRGPPESPADPPETPAERAGAWLDSALRGLGRSLFEALPVFERQLRLVRSLYADATVRLTCWGYNRRHAAPIEPYRVLWVDPARIVRLSRHSTRPRFRRLGTVVDGDWDRCEIRFRETDVFYAFERHFEEGVPWEETAFFSRVLEEMNEGAERWGCTSRSEFRDRCERLDRLYESLREHGFYSQRQLLESGVDDPVEYRRATVAERIINDEIAVDVARDGELLFADGRNRLAIAKILGVDAVPVVVLRRHAQWAAWRDAVATFLENGGDLRGRLREHPDLASLREAARS